MIRGIALGVGAAVSLSFAGHAQTRKAAVPAEVRAVAGAWQVARLDEWPDTCPLRLTSVQAIGGYAVVLGRGCDTAFAPHDNASSWSADIYAWRPGAKGTIVLADAVRHSIMTFTYIRMGTGEHAWIGHGPDGQDYELIRDLHPGQHKVMSDE